MRLERIFSRQRLYSWLPLIVSAFVHVLVLAVLSLLLVPAIQRAGIWLNAGASRPQDYELIEATLESDFDASLPDGDTIAFQPDLRPIDLPEFALDDLLPEKRSSAVRIPVVVGDNGSLRQANSVETAVDGITSAIEGALQEGDLTVVWLFDASHSLVDDRQRIAERLKSFLSGGADKPGKLTNIVASFGALMKERVRATDSRERIIRSIKNLPIDPSGEERVFEAVEKCISKYSAGGRQLLLVVWTDESGDDAERLEKTTALSRSRNVHVHVVGPSAVLGNKTGLHAYTDSKSDVEYLLPVTRGPDTAAEERLRLGYWFVTPPLDNDDSRYPAWYGGPELVGMSSPFSPFALTRLAMETGGSFTILDSPDDRSPFDLETMKDYLPYYGSVTAYANELELYPLRAAIRDAVEVTRGQRELTVPPLALFATRSDVPPYRLEGPYLTPTQFARKLRAERSKLIQQAARTARLVERALACISKDGVAEHGLEEWYAQETSPRWRAWYDLTRGRLLAASVRLEEYRLACETLADRDALKESTNFILLLATRRMRSSEMFADRAREAKELLYRCVRQNSDTPWDYLAQRELRYAFGIQIQQQSLEPTGELPSQRPALPKF